MAVVVLLQAAHPQALAAIRDQVPRVPVALRPRDRLAAMIQPLLTAPTDGDVDVMTLPAMSHVVAAQMMLRGMYARGVVQTMPRVTYVMAAARTMC